jgi:hypothetical protein
MSWKNLFVQVHGFLCERRASTLALIGLFITLLFLAGDIRLPNDKPLFSFVIELHTCEAYQRIADSLVYKFDSAANLYAMYMMGHTALVPEATMFLAHEAKMAVGCEKFKHNIGHYASGIGGRLHDVLRNIVGLLTGNWPGFDLAANICGLIFNTFFFFLFSAIYPLQWITIQIIGIILFVPHGLICASAMIFGVRNYWFLLSALYAVYITIFGTLIWFVDDHWDQIRPWIPRLRRGRGSQGAIVPEVHQIVGPDADKKEK